METLIDQWTAGIKSGEIVPILGPGVLADVRSIADGTPMPADSDSLILAMNGGKPMSPKLMYEFSRAAMNIELKRGRTTITKFLTRTYGETAWTRAALHDWLAALEPRYVIDANRDVQLQDSFARTPHLLVAGLARLGGTEWRFRLYAHDGTAYREVKVGEVDPALPILFKPLGTPRPSPSYIASDADYVDYLTELMGGFAVPPHIKALRRGKRYLMLGLRFTRDTERMLVSDLIHDAAPMAGWAIIEQATEKERRFLSRHGVSVVEAPLTTLLQETAAAA